MPATREPAPRGTRWLTIPLRRRILASPRRVRAIKDLWNQHQLGEDGSNEPRRAQKGKRQQGPTDEEAVGNRLAGRKSGDRSWTLLEVRVRESRYEGLSFRA